MDELAIAFAKLAGTRKALASLLSETYNRGTRHERPTSNFSAAECAPLFHSTAQQLKILQVGLAPLFGDFPAIATEPTTKMVDSSPEPLRYGRSQLETLARAIDQLFEIRANSELAAPATAQQEPRVFISHGRANDWREVQSFIERDLGMRTLELAQEANLGRTVLQKLEQESRNCTSAVILMTGDDFDGAGVARARENVLHEIGYFQGHFGLSAVCVLHEEGTNIPSNIHGLVYIPFPKGTVSATFGALMRELKTFYRI